MTDYRTAQRIADEIANVKNEIFEALKGKDFDSYEKLHELEANLEYAIESFGYFASCTYDFNVFVRANGRVVFRVKGAIAISLKEEN